MVLKNIISLFSFLAFSAALAAEEPEARLLGSVDAAGGVKLQWQVSSWPPDLKGFRIMRKTPQSDWSPIGPASILPGYFDRDWDSYGVSSAALPVVVARLESFTSDGENSLPSGHAIERLREYGSVPTGTLILFDQNWHNALVGGFGYVDREAGRGDGFIYGLFAIFENGKTSKYPISTFSTEEYLTSLNRAVGNLDAKFIDGISRMSWTLSDSVYDNVGICGYYVYRTKIGEGKSVRMNDVLLWGEENISGDIDFEYKDEVGEATAIWEYSIEPITVFQQKLPRSAVRCIAVKNLPPPSRPHGARMKDGRHQINWEMPGQAGIGNATFSVERYVANDEIPERYLLEGEVPDDWYVEVVSGLEPDSRSWTDNLRVSESTHCFYRVGISDQESGEALFSSGFVMLLEPNIPPPPVSNLTARLVPDDQKSRAKVRLEWTERATDEIGIESFMVASDKGSEELLYHSSFQIVDNFIELRVGSPGKICTFQIVPKGHNGLLGSARQVKLYVPKLRLDPFPKGAEVTYEPYLNELASTVRWEYGDRTDLSGFRIRHLKTGEIIADTDEIGPDADEWLWRGEGLLKEQTIPIEIEAVGVFDYITSLPKVAYLKNVPLHYGRNYSLPEADFKSIAIYENNGTKILTLEWEPWAEELFSEVERLGIGPAEANKYTPIPLYQIGWHQYLESSNGKLVVELPNFLEGVVQMRLVPMYLDDNGRLSVPGVFTQFSINLDKMSGALKSNDIDAADGEDSVPLENVLKWKTRLIEEQAELSDEFMAGAFQFENTGSSPLEITKIKSSCGCTTTQLDKKLYLPGESGEIVATFEFEGRTGRQTKVVDVYVDGYEEPVRLVMRTTIPRVLSIKPAYHTWKRGDPVEPKYSEISVEVEEAVSLTEVIASDSSMATELETIEPGKRYRLKLTPADTAEKTQIDIDVNTDFPPADPQSYRIRAVIK